MIPLLRLSPSFFPDMSSSLLKNIRACLKSLKAEHVYDNVVYVCSTTPAEGDELSMYREISHELTRLLFVEQSGETKDYIQFLEDMSVYPGVFAFLMDHPTTEATRERIRLQKAKKEAESNDIDTRFRCRTCGGKVIIAGSNSLRSADEGEVFKYECTSDKSHNASKPITI